MDRAAWARARGAGVSNEELSQRVARAIAGNLPGTKAGEDWWMSGWRVEGPDNVWSFTVDEHDGVVVLDGEVPRYALVRQAVKATGQVSGVRSVRSNLSVGEGYLDLHPSSAYPPHPQRSTR